MLLIFLYFCVVCCLHIKPLFLPNGISKTPSVHPDSSSKRDMYRCGRTIGHLTVGEFTVTVVPLFLFAFQVSSWEIGKAERRWLGTSSCDNERTNALRKNALRPYEGKSSELIPPGPRSRVGSRVRFASRYKSTQINGDDKKYLFFLSSPLICADFFSRFSQAPTRYILLLAVITDRNFKNTSKTLALPRRRCSLLSFLLAN